MLMCYKNIVNVPASSRILSTVYAILCVSILTIGRTYLIVLVQYQYTYDIKLAISVMVFECSIAQKRRFLTKKNRTILQIKKKRHT